jgi:hypothetical protein
MCVCVCIDDDGHFFFYLHNQVDSSVNSCQQKQYSDTFILSTNVKSIFPLPLLLIEGKQE